MALVSRRHGDTETEACLAGLPIGQRRGVASALKFCLIASGEADIYVRCGRDHGVGHGRRGSCADHGRRQGRRALGARDHLMAITASSTATALSQPLGIRAIPAVSDCPIGGPT